MANRHVMTLENPAGLLITPEILEQIGVGTGDQIEISVSDDTLIVRSLTVAETERKKVASLKDAKDDDDEATVTIRELINEELAARFVEEATGIELTLADGRMLLFHHEDDPQLDEVVKRADVKGIHLLISAKAGGRTVDDIMESIMDRHDNLFRRLAEGVK
ncbi:MAG: AbrB/MazE/SpoVT family DNA-binding domain-containing protein [Blastocatellia bacterium]